MREAISDVLDQLRGQPCSRARRGYGSFITFDIGQPTPEAGAERWQWHLWVYSADWALVGPDGVLARDSDPYLQIEAAIALFMGKDVLQIGLDPSSMRADLTFTGELRLELRPHSDPDPESAGEVWWRLFTLRKKVLVVGSYPNWIYQSEDEPW